MKFVLVGNVLLCDTETLGISLETFALKHHFLTSRVSSWRTSAFHGCPCPASAAGGLPGSLLQGKAILILEQFCLQSWSRLLGWAGPVPTWWKPSETNHAFFFILTRSYTTNSQKFRGLGAREDFGLWGSSVPVRKDINWKYHSCFTVLLSPQVGFFWFNKFSAKLAVLPLTARDVAASSYSLLAW